MKIKGIKFDGPREEVVVIPRSSGDIVFKARAVMDYSDFDKINPRPEPPIKILPGGVKSQNVEDPVYLKKVSEWAEQKTNWMILQALEATPDLEWETVDKADPKTWGNFRTELEKAGFSQYEIAKIIGCVIDACGLNQSKIDEATDRFLASQREKPVLEFTQKVGQ